MHIQRSGQTKILRFHSKIELKAYLVQTNCNIRLARSFLMVKDVTVLKIDHPNELIEELLIQNIGGNFVAPHKQIRITSDSFQNLCQP